MNLKVLGSSSSGNCYILETEKEALILEAGYPFASVKKALNFNISKIVGTLISHVHGDHAMYAHTFADAGINIYMNEDTADSITTKAKSAHRCKVYHDNTVLKLGNFTIKFFEVKHDVRCHCFLIHHPESGIVLFATDTYYIPYTFRGLNNIIVEANFEQAIIDEMLKGDNKFRRDRVMKSHLSIEHCLNFLRANDLSAVNNIVLIHLSDGNSHEKRFKKLVEDQTGKSVFVADSGMIIPFNEKPF